MYQMLPAMLLNEVQKQNAELTNRVRLQQEERTGAEQQRHHRSGSAVRLRQRSRRLRFRAIDKLNAPA